MIGYGPRMEVNFWIWASEGVYILDMGVHSCMQDPLIRSFAIYVCIRIRICKGRYGCSGAKSVCACKKRDGGCDANMILVF